MTEVITGVGDVECYEPIVSVGLPVFNGEAYIAEAVQSLLNQSYRQLELIISDNGSADRTQKICEKFAASDARVRYFRQSENFGGQANFEFVFRHARGRYFMWAAHDDVWSPTWIERLVGRINGKRDVCAFGRVLHIDEPGRQVPHIASDRSFDYSSNSSLARRLKFFMEPEALGKANAVYGLFPREAIEKYSPVLLRGGYGYGDCVMLWCMMSQYRLAGVDDSFLYKRLHEGAASGGRPRTVSQRGWCDKVKGLYFMIGMNLSFRGNSDYLRADPGLTALICLLLAPVKMLLSIFKVRAAVRHMSSVKTANG
ncbi:glycosyltransferase [Rhodobacterales bacterium LSUCC0031]|nr:glycosyltransferase [Rhodobacterales bacterium LSUCC0031]